LMSDGDNICLMCGGWATDPKWFGSPDRGKIPLGFTMSPALAALQPSVLAYAHSHATENDTLVAGPSGLGYIYPDKFSDLALFSNQTAQFMNKGGLRLLNIIGAVPDPTSLDSFTASDDIDGVFWYSFPDGYSGMRGAVHFLNDKPVIGGRVSLWGDSKDTKVDAHGKLVNGDMLGVDALVDYLTRFPKTTTSSEGYSLVPVNLWGHNVSDVVRAVELLNAKGGFKVVTPAEFVRLVSANVPHQGQTGDCPLPTGPFSSTCESCEFSGEGSCLMQCDCPYGTAGQHRTSTCDLRDCATGLVNRNGEIVCGDRPLKPVCKKAYT